MIKNNVIGHRRTYSNALRCGLSRLAMIKNSSICLFGASFYE